MGPVEKVGDEFVVHGLGNFLSGMHSDPRTSDGLIVHANAVEQRGSWRFESIDVTPTDVTSRGWRILIPDAGTTSYNRTMNVVSSMDAPFGLYEIPPLADWQLAMIE